MVGERRSRIAEQVWRDGTASIETLAVQLGITGQTIRRDVNAVCEGGILLRRHDGVVPPPRADLQVILPVAPSLQGGSA